MFGMLERLENGWDMSLESLRVLRKDPELLVFPLFSSMFSGLVMGSFALPLWFTGYAQWLAQQPERHKEPLVWLIVFAFYAINYFVILFFNSALVACAIIRLRGGDPTLADGFRAAVARLPQIVGWALVSATVGLVLKIVESRSKRGGEIFAGIMGMVWSVATFFVVPVLVVEKVGPLDALKRSSAVIRNAWGEAFVADLGIGLMGFLLSIPGFIFCVLGAMSLSRDLLPQGLLLVAIGVVYLLGVGLVTSVLEMIARAGLYVQAADEKVLRRFEKRILGEVL